MKTIHYIVITGLAAGIILVLSLPVFLNNIYQLPPPKFAEPVQKEVKKIGLVIDDGEGRPESFNADFKEKITAFDLLKEGAGKLNLAVETKTYDIGIFIEAIGNKKNGQGGKYWLYYVNKETAPVAADKKELKDGDVVEFKFEKPSF